MTHPISAFFVRWLSLFLMAGSVGYSQTTWIKSGANPVLQKTGYSNLNWEFYALSDCWVLRDKDTLKMWYTGGGVLLPDTIPRSRIGYAWSIDGIQWTQLTTNPVLDVSPGKWDSLGVETASVIKDTAAPAAERYKMWYAGNVDTLRYDIGYAYSADGIHWTKHPGNPVLSVGDAASWENGFLEGPTVLEDNDTLKMWYAALDNSWDGKATDGHVNIGYAWSLNGVNWTRYAGNPVFSVGNAGQWDAAYISDPHVIKANGKFHMWYGGTAVYDNYYQKTGYAWSTDGIHWTRDANNPVLSNGPAGTWDANTASFPSVLIENNKYRMWYTGKDTMPLPDYPTPYYWDLGYAEGNLPSETEGTEISPDNVPEVFPNPFNPIVNIRLSADAGVSELFIYNGRGVLVSKLACKGTTSAKWDASSQPSGMYLLKIRIAGKLRVRKIVLLK